MSNSHSVYESVLPAVIPRTAWLLLPIVGVLAAGYDFWSQSDTPVFDAMPMAVTVAVPVLAAPGLLLGLGLLAADCFYSDYRYVWIAIEVVLIGVMLLAGLWLGQQMNF